MPVTLHADRMRDDSNHTPTDRPVPEPTVWSTLNYVDARAAIAFLSEVVGFRTTLIVPADDDPKGPIAHAELRWPEGGGVMLGSAGRPDSEFSQLPTGCGSVYVVTDDPWAVHDRAVAAGVTIVRQMEDADYGSTGFALADPEGNLWSFGTYRGEP